MKKFKLFTVLALATVFAFTSCKEEKAAVTDAANDAVEAVEQGVTAVAENVTSVADASSTPVPTGPTTTIKFDEDTYDWGTIMDGDKVTHVYKFKNTGNEPLIISNAKGSCGCTVPEWPKDAIAPGQSGEIKVIFNSQGKGAVGGKEDAKRVTITANTDPADTYLTIKGIVDKKEG